MGSTRIWRNTWFNSDLTVMSPNQIQLPYNRLQKFIYTYIYIYHIYITYIPYRYIYIYMYIHIPYMYIYIYYMYIYIYISFSFWFQNIPSPGNLRPICRWTIAPWTPRCCTRSRRRPRKHRTRRPPQRSRSRWRGGSCRMGCLSHYYPIFIINKINHFWDDNGILYIVLLSSLFVILR